MTITFEHVTFRYAPDEPPALNDLGVHFKTSRLIGMCGRAGSGKSTCIQHLNGILKPASGRVLIDGEDIHATKQALQRVRRRIGMSFQFPERQLFGRTVWEELTYTLEYHKLSPDAQERRVTEACQWLDFDLPRYRAWSPFSLSRNEQRKLGSAVVLALRPELVVFDEPTAGFDRKQAYRLLDTLYALHRRGLCQVMLVSHDIELLLEYADEIVVFGAGTIVWQGTPQALLDSPQCLELSGLMLPEVYAKLRQSGGQFSGLPSAGGSLHSLLQKLARPAPLTER